MTHKQVFIINSDLKMSCGKMAVQVAHGEVLYMELISERLIDNCIDNCIKKHYDWRESTQKDPIGLMKKIVLKATKKQTDEIVAELCFRKIWCSVIYDKGLTQVPNNSLTCLIVEPLIEEQCTELFGHLKLL